MLTLLIADDKPSARAGLKKIIDWEAEGIEVIDLAIDGREALEKSVALIPDILLTDIKMPFFNGLEVARELNERGLKTRTIIVSGIADFDFARDAVELNAEGYLLKPVKIDELTALIRKLVEDIEVDRKKEKSLREMQQRLNESLPVLRSNFLKELISPGGASHTTKELKDELSALDIQFDPENRCLIAIIELDNYPEFKRNSSAGERRLLQLSLLELLREAFSKIRHLAFQVADNEIAIICELPDENLTAFSKAIDVYQKDVGKMLDVSVSAGVSAPMANLTNLGEAYREAGHAIQQRFYTGDNVVLSYEHSLPGRDEVMDVSRRSLRGEIIDAVEIGDTRKMKSTLESFFKSFPPEDIGVLPKVQAAAAELIILSVQSLLSLNQGTEGVEIQTILPSVFTTKNVYNLHSFAEGILTDISERFSQKHLEQKNSMVENVKDYINKNFGKKISMSDITQEVFYTPNYISLVFSRITGQTVKEYITAERIRYAKQLLKTTDKLIFEIAEECGYDNARYFSTVFRKATDQTPMQYRDGGEKNIPSDGNR